MAKNPKAAARQKRYDDKHKAEKAIRRKKWLEKNPNYFRDWSAKNKDKIKAASRKNILKDYGLTIESYNELRNTQDGHCAFPGCTATEFRQGRKDFLAVDHDHSTNKVRGLLCYRHNILIGLARESVSELEAAISYVRSHKNESKSPN